MLFDTVWRAWWRRFWLLDEEECLPAKTLQAEFDLAPLPAPSIPMYGRWIALRVGGGGRFETPPMLEEAATDYVTRHGAQSIVAVDRVNRYIFYATKR